MSSKIYNKYTKHVYYCGFRMNLHRIGCQYRGHPIYIDILFKKGRRLRWKRFFGKFSRRPGVYQAI